MIAAAEVDGLLLLFGGVLVLFFVINVCLCPVCVWCCPGVVQLVNFEAGPDGSGARGVFTASVTFFDLGEHQVTLVVGGAVLRRREDGKELPNIYQKREMNVTVVGECPAAPKRRCNVAETLRAGGVGRWKDDRWTPVDCYFPQYSQEEAFALLSQQRHLIVIGDSYLRGIFRGFVATAEDREFYDATIGSPRISVPIGSLDQPQYVVRIGDSLLEFHGYSSCGQIPVYPNMIVGPKTLVLHGLGVHEISGRKPNQPWTDFDEEDLLAWNQKVNGDAHECVQRLAPLFKYLNSPRHFMYSVPHYNIGFRKPADYSFQGVAIIRWTRSYLNAMRSFADQATVFDHRRVTAGVPDKWHKDGHHYQPPVTDQMANMLYNYFELTDEMTDEEFKAALPEPLEG